ncbi:MAG: CvpA family protein, partial [Segetibacter sp.]|nr:CvpA family protein [Segetibacter sp.]
MNWIDIFLIAIVILSALSGFQKGFIVGVLDLALLLGSFLFALWSYQYGTVLLDKYVPSLGVWSQPLAFILIIILVRIIMSVIINSILSATPRGAHQNFVNKFLGLGPGIVNGVIYAVIVAALLLATPLFDGLSAATHESRLANRLAEPAEWLENKLSPVFDEAVKRSMNSMTVEPTSEKSVKLPFTVTKYKVRPDLEARMLDLVNEERAKAGLKP